MASDDEGLVAWLPDDVDADLVVRNLATRTEVARVAVSGPGRVIAIDGGQRVLPATTRATTS